MKEGEICVSLWTDLLVMALTAPCHWLCLSYSKAARDNFPHVSLLVVTCLDALQQVRAAQHPGACRVMHALALPETVHIDMLSVWLASLEPKAALGLQGRCASWLCLVASEAP